MFANSSFPSLFRYINRTPVVKSIIGSSIFLRNTATKTGMLDEVLYDLIRQA